MLNVFHPFHLVTVSPWPLIVGMGSMFMVMGVAKMMFFVEYDLLLMAFFLLMLSVTLWWRDVIRESTFEGSHVEIVVKGLVVGMVLFIISELFFFVSFFWAFFHSSLVPAVELGGFWPPSGVVPFNPFQVPLLNTVILLSSGVSITWAHQCILVGKMGESSMAVMVTWVLGLYFLVLQMYEYNSAMFSISDSVYGSVFFVATGFHGMHVMIGSVFLIVVWFRVMLMHFSENHHFGFEAAAWYWHFVDVIWLFLFIVVYWWGG